MGDLIERRSASVSTVPELATALHSANVLGDLLAEAARRAPDKGMIFASGEAGEQPGLLTYRQLYDKARVLLAELQARGAATPGGTMVIVMDRADEFLTALWSGLLAGMSVCGVRVPRTDQRRLDGLLNHAASLFGAPLLVADPDVIRALPEGVGFGDVFAYQEPQRSVEDARVHRPSPDQVALLPLTSGSTGNPKAVRLSHQTVLAGIAAQANLLDFSTEDVTLLGVGIDHAVGLLPLHLLPMGFGVNQVHSTPENLAADPLRLLRLIDQHRASIGFCPNFFLRQIVHAVDAAGPDFVVDLSSMRMLTSGGEANRVATGLELLNRLARFGMARDALVPAYGMTETCSIATVDRGFPDGDRDHEIAAVGQPSWAMRVRITSLDNGVPLPDGELGALEVSGPMVTDGYHNNEQANAEAFTADGWMRTGDIALIDGGRLRLSGRSKDTVVVNAKTYFSAELELLLHDIPGLDLTSLAAFSTREKDGDTEQLVIAFAVTDDIDSDEKLLQVLRAISISTILKWGFRPQFLLPLLAADFPKSNIGKILRSAMRRRFESGDFHEARSRVETMLRDSRGAYIAPANQTESEILDIFADILSEDPAEISTTANFVDLGGTSLEILQLQQRINNRFNSALRVSDLLTTPSIQQLARRVNSADTDVYQPIVTLQNTGSKTPVFLLHNGAGNVLAYVNLAQYFAYERPVFAIQPRGVNPTEEPFADLTELLDTYEAAIREQQPCGPYVIVGLSMSTPLAFELARRFEAAGDEMGLVGLGDRPPFAEANEAWEDFVFYILVVLFGLEAITTPQGVELDVTLRTMDTDEQLRHAYATASPERLAETNTDFGEFSRAVYRVKYLMSLIDGYTPSGTVNAPMTVFTAMTSIERQPFSTSYANNDQWRRFTSGRFENVALHEGTHETMLSAKHVANFHRILRGTIEVSLQGR